MPFREQFQTDEAFRKALRDWFAGKAMAALIGNLPSDDADDEMRTLGYGAGETDRFVSKAAYDYADSMLAARGAK